MYSTSRAGLVGLTSAPITHQLRAQVGHAGGVSAWSAEAHDKPLSDGKDAPGGRPHAWIADPYRASKQQRDIDAVFATLVQVGAGGLVVCPDAFLVSRRGQIAALAIRHTMPTIYFQSEFPAAGGLMSYGPSVTDGYRQVGIYAARILKGERPGDLPVQQSTKFSLVINLSTAKVLGLDVPFYLQQLADEVIE
jgi:hypothetical protein